MPNLLEFIRSGRIMSVLIGVVFLSSVSETRAYFNRRESGCVVSPRTIASFLYAFLISCSVALGWISRTS